MKQTCILILGMHRSGTSALSGILNLLDVYLGTELMKPMEQQNAKGFYENTHLYKVNEKLLKQMNSRWDDSFYTESKLNTLEDTTEIEEVLKHEFQYSQTFAIKDPRLAYLFPIYTKALKNMGVDVKVIIPFRNPLEVAESLRTRNQFSQEKSLLLWVCHFLLSEKLSRGFPRVFTRFDELVNSPETVVTQINQKLQLDLFTKYESQKEKIQEFLTPGLKHHNIALDNMSDKVPKLIKDVVSLVPQLNEESFDTRFDGLRRQFFDNQSLFYNSDIINSLQELELSEKELLEKGKRLEQAIITKDMRLEQISLEFHMRLEQINQKLQAKEIELDKLKLELTAVYSSSSWKITRPMRKVIRKLKRR